MTIILIFTFCINVAIIFLVAFKMFSSQKFKYGTAMCIGF